MLYFPLTLYQPEGVESRVHVPRMVGAAVDVVVTYREEVNIMEDEAVKLV